MPERWPQVERIYSAVVAQPESEWATVLADLCASDDSLRHEVESLLEHENAASRFLETAACAGADVTGHLASERVLSGRRFGSSVDVLALDEALDTLSSLDVRQCRVADALGVSTATVEREWAMAKAWLQQRLSTPQEPSAG